MSEELYSQFTVTPLLFSSLILCIGGKAVQAAVQKLLDMGVDVRITGTIRLFIPKGLHARIVDNMKINFGSFPICKTSGVDSNLEAILFNPDCNSSLNFS